MGGYAGDLAVLCIVWLVLCSFLLPSSIVAQAAATISPTVLTNTAQIRALNSDEASQIPLQTISQIRRPQTNSLTHRSKIHGTLLVWRPGALAAVRDQTGAIWIQTDQTLSLTPGDQIEAVGFPSYAKGQFRLVHSLIRRLQPGKLPAPKPVQIQAVFSENYDADWIQLHGRLVQMIHREANVLITLEDQNVVFAVVVDPKAATNLNAIPLGSRIQVTGACATEQRHTNQHRALTLYVPATETPKLLARPSRWTIHHTYSLACVLGIVALASLCCVAILKRQVANQTAVIRQRLEHEAALETRYRELVENANDIIYVHDLKGRFLSFNRTMERLTGLNRQHDLGRNIDEFVAPESLDLVRTMMQRKLAGGETTRYEIKAIGKDGRKLTLEVSSRLLIHNGTPIGVQGIARDITERTDAEEKLRRSENQYRHLVETSQDLIWSIDAQGRLTYVNTYAAKRIYGFEPEEMLGRTFSSLAAPGQAPIDLLTLDRVQQGESFFQYEAVHRRNDGSPVTLHFHALVLRDSHGRVLGATGTASDVTERRRADNYNAALAQLGHRLSAALSNRDAARTVSEIAFDLLGWDAFYLHVYDAKTDQMVPILNVDLVEGQRVEVPTVYPDMRPSPWLRTILRDGKQIILRDPAAADPYPELIPFGNVQRRSASLLFVPIHNQNDVVGVLSIQSYTPRAYTNESLDLLQFLADHWGGALERLRMLEAIRQSEERFQFATRATNDVIWDWNLTNNEVWWNYNFTACFGHPLDRNPARLESWSDRIHLKDKERVLAGIREVIASRGHAWFDEYKFQRHDGSFAFVMDRGYVIHDPSGTPVRMIGAMQDISARKNAELEIQKLAAFPKVNPNPVIELAHDGSVTYANDAAQELMLKLNRRNVADILPPEAKTLVATCLATGEKRTGVETVVCNRTLSWSFCPIPSNQVVHCYGVDITDRMSLESQLRHAQKLECVGQLAAGLAHDFNNILTIIQCYANLLLEDADPASETAAKLCQISRASDRAAHLTNQLLTFSRRHVLQLNLINLNEVISHVVSILQRVLPENIELKFAAQPHLPLVSADASMLEHVTMNLALNARDAMPKGGSLTITTAYQQIDEAYHTANPEAQIGPHVCLTVSDTGIGMDPATLNRIFEPFFTTKEVGKGTGLGLATAYGIIKQHQGWIEVTSQPGLGTSFRVLLPAASLHPNSTEPAPAPSESMPRGYETILLVEDEPDLRFLAAKVLTRCGYRILEAASGNEALKIWNNQPNDIHLLLTDMVMPEGMTGGELAAQLHAAQPQLKILYTSGYSPEIMEGSPLKDNRRHFLPKPFQPVTLAQAVRKCLDS